MEPWDLGTKRQKRGMYWTPMDPLDKWHPLHPSHTADNSNSNLTYTDKAGTSRLAPPRQGRYLSMSWPLTTSHTV